jgi:hypothetical protein
MANYTRYTLGDLIDQLTERLGENSTFWVHDEKRDSLNEALNVWQLMVGEFTFGITLGVTGGTFYSVPAQIGAIQRVLFNGSSLTLSSVNELDLGNPGWQGVEDDPEFYVLMGVNLFALSPQPSSGTISIEGISETPTLTNDGDYVMLGDEVRNRILDYAEHYCSFKEGVGEFDSQMTGFGLFIDAAGKRNSVLLATALYRQWMGRNREEQGRPSEVPSPPVAR